MNPPIEIRIRITGPDGATGNARGHGWVVNADGTTIDAPFGIGPLAGPPISAVTALAKLLFDNYKAALLSARAGAPPPVRDDIDLRRAVEAAERAAGDVDNTTLTTSAALKAGG